MSVFGSYSRYYNLLYKDKDYVGEAAYLAALLKRHSTAPVQTLLELGCGTGKHAALLGGTGIRVTGVDRSPEMIDQARGLAESLSGIPESARPSFHQGDIASVRFSEKFDAVCSLFHVMSYQTSNEDLMAAFRTAREHLNPGGLFLFDVWYGPAVLTDRPAVRIKRMSDDHGEIVRLAEPGLNPAENVVEVNYEIIVRGGESAGSESLKETHRMRYLFGPELALFALQSGFSDIVHSEEWMTGRRPGFDTWGVVYGAKA